MRMTLKNHTVKGGSMIDPMSFLLLLVLACWAIRELCGLIDRRHRKARGDHR
jgi:hypothetical protein